MPHDLRYALRLMVKSPAFTAVAILTLALGIGANTAIFSVVNALVLRPLPLGDPDRLVLISVSNPARGFRGSSFSLASYEALRDRNRTFSGIAGFCFDALTLTGGAEPEQLAAARVSPNFFDVLGTQPSIGRGFRAADGDAGAAPVALISSGLWQRRFASDPGVLGKTISLDQEVYSIIGVLPAEYAFPSPGQDVWVSRVMKYGRLQPEQIQQGAGFLNSFARLAPGATLQQADAEVARITVQYREEHPRAPDADPNAHLDVAPLQDSLTTQIRPTLLILTGAVGFVLLIACANVAGLMMARATGRAKEIAVRSALGARRAQIVRQLLAECLLLAVAGAVLGTLLAAWGVEWLVKADGREPSGLSADPHGSVRPRFHSTRLRHHRRCVRTGSRTGSVAPESARRPARWRMGHDRRKPGPPPAQPDGCRTDGALHRPADRRRTPARKFSPSTDCKARLRPAPHSDRPTRDPAREVSRRGPPCPVRA
jgi:predicted permease